MLRFMARSSPFTVSMPGPPISDGTAITAIRTPPGVIGSNLRSPCRGTPWLCGSPLRFLTATRQEFSTTVKATLAGQQEKTVAACAVGASLIPISEYQGGHEEQGCRRGELL